MASTRMIFSIPRVIHRRALDSASALAPGLGRRVSTDPLAPISMASCAAGRFGSHSSNQRGGFSLHAPTTSPAFISRNHPGQPPAQPIPTIPIFLPSPCPPPASAQASNPARTIAPPMPPIHRPAFDPHGSVPGVEHPHCPLPKICSPSIPCLPAPAQGVSFPSCVFPLGAFRGT